MDEAVTKLTRLDASDYSIYKPLIFMPVIVLATILTALAIGILTLCCALISMPWIVLATISTAFAIGIFSLCFVLDFHLTVEWIHRAHGGAVGGGHRCSACMPTFGSSGPPPSANLPGGSNDQESPSYYNPRDLWIPSSRERDLDFQSQRDADNKVITKASTEQERYLAIVETMARLENESLSLGSTSSTAPFKEPIAASEQTGSNMATVEELAQHPPTFQQPPSLRCCNNTFRTQADYNRHRRYHDKPEACPHCPRDFGTTKDLNRHINDIHERTKVFYCLETTCKRSRTMRGKGFPRKDNWRRHMKDAHGIDVN